MRTGTGMAGGPMPNQPVPFVVSVPKGASAQAKPAGPAQAKPVAAAAPAKTNATAEFLGYQETGFPGEQAIPLYNVKGGPLNGSTVGADTLRQNGIKVPDVTAPKARPAAASTEPDIPSSKSRSARGQGGTTMSQNDRKVYSDQIRAGKTEDEAIATMLKQRAERATANYAREKDAAAARKADKATPGVVAPAKGSTTEQLKASLDKEMRKGTHTAAAPASSGGLTPAELNVVQKAFAEGLDEPAVYARLLAFRQTGKP